MASPRLLDSGGAQSSCIVFTHRNFFELVIVSRLYSNNLNFLWANRSNSARDLTDKDLSASLIILNTWVIIKLIDFSKKRFSTVKHFNS